MLGKVILSQIFAIPIAWASTIALTEMYDTFPWYFTILIWGFVSIFVIAKLK